MRNKSKYLILFAFLLSYKSTAQFGNEWIDFSQSWFKVKVVREDFYRITSAELSAAGFPVSAVAANKIQLFRRGEEIAINVNANGDGTVNYLEFYGQGNDGTGDSQLYDIGDQPHTFYNLFSDTAVYFLTYKLGVGNGKRMGFSSDSDASGITAEAFHLKDTIQVYFSDYAPGIKFGSGAAFNLSKYDDGETWTGQFLGKGGFTNHNFVLENRIAGQNPVCDFVLVGGNSQNHNASLRAGPDASSLVDLNTTQFNGWGSTSDSFIIPESNIGAGGELIIQALREGFPSLSERFSVAYMRIRYPQTISMQTDENKIFTLDDPVGAKAYFQIGTTNAAGTSVFDVNDPVNPIRIATTNFSDRVEVVIPGALANHKVLAVTNPSSVPLIEPVTLTMPDLTGKDYLIISHADLRGSGDPVNDYKSYRESAAGGNYQVEITNVAALFDLFNYGDPSPVAIRSFIQYAVSVAPIEYVFIIGKGFTPNANYYRGAQATVNIPTFGLPGSDLMYTLGIGTGPEVPGIAIGRLNAFTPDDVTAYLNKLTEMEALPFNDLWRKDFLQLSGGISQGELDTFAGYIQEFTDVLEKDFIGGRAFNTGKQTGESVEFVDVADRVNQGVGYVTFFGHSSGTVTDIEIGRVSNPEFGFSNEGRYPVFLVNGCKAGEIFGGNFTFGEDWMITPDLGAVGFIAHADFASGNTLRRWSNLFYETGFANETFIGESIGKVLLEVSQKYFDQNGTSGSSLTQVQQMLYQGDPAYRIFGADNPDYQIDDTSIFAESLDGGEVLASQDSFKINVITKNFGRSVTDSLLVQVDRVLSDGTLITTVNKFLRPLRQDTLEIFIQNDPTQNNNGLNILTVTLDPENTTTELDETNNIATLPLTIFTGNTSHLYPFDNGTTSSSQIEFVWQSSNLLEEERSYDLEVDTSPDFDSPNRRSFAVIGEVLLRSTFDFSQFSLQDSSTIYWRTKFTDPQPDENDNWVTTSFTMIDGISDGWGQYESSQLQNAFVSGVEYNSTSGRWEFIQTTTPIDIFTFGSANSAFQYADIEAIINGIDFMVTSNTIDPFCRQNTFNVIAFDKESGDPYTPIVTNTIDVFNNEVCGRLPQKIYNFIENDILVNGRLQTLVDNMRDGDQIVLFNIGNVTYSNWDAAVESTLNSLGISSATINNLTDGQPVIFFGRKGDPPGSALELINDGTVTPITEQSLELVDNVSGSFTSGTLRTRRIGPVLEWLEYSFNIEEDVNDTYSLKVFGIDGNGTSSEIPEFERARAETLDISTIDPEVFPEMELEFSFSDDTDLTPPQLNFWEVNYTLPPDGMLVSENKSLTNFLEGDQIARTLSFYNYSSVDFSDSLDVVLRLINQISGSTQTDNIRIFGPMAGDSTEFTTSFSSTGFDGSNSLIVEVSANENERFDFNNRLTLVNLIEVEPDDTNPVLDVTFDGNHILDGDIVSPSPSIVVRMRDDNPFLFKNDTSGVNVFFRQSGDESSYQRIGFSDPALNFTSASETRDFEIEFNPGPLEDGIYGFRVQAEDESGNEAGSEPYEVNFEVINESTVTHFYPYPNPFSTSCRFVFTLTGNEIPDEIKIQILTVSGRVVREITQDEVGPIRIGNNITEYAWDGRDEFGDQLANGVYFYRVFVNSGGQELNQRVTSADGAFKNGFGKLYILR
ncbi:MAG: C25 family cysteine peptidase [Cyclobacteriaceae bacterium]